MYTIDQVLNRLKTIKLYDTKIMKTSAILTYQDCLDMVLNGVKNNNEKLWLLSKMQQEMIKNDHEKNFSDMYNFIEKKYLELKNNGG